MATTEQLSEWGIRFVIAIRWSIDGEKVKPLDWPARIVAALEAGGVLIYETFMVGNERFGKPSNPDFLLRSHELFERVAGACTVLAYEQGEVAEPKQAVIQRICAVKGHNPSLRLP